MSTHLFSIGTNRSVTTIKTNRLAPYVHAAFRLNSILLLNTPFCSPDHTIAQFVLFHLKFLFHASESSVRGPFPFAWAHWLTYSDQRQLQVEPIVSSQLQSMCHMSI